MIQSPGPGCARGVWVPLPFMIAIVLKVLMLFALQALVLFEYPHLFTRLFI